MVDTNLHPQQLDGFVGARCGAAHLGDVKDGDEQVVDRLVVDRLAAGKQELDTEQGADKLALDRLAGALMLGSYRHDDLANLIGYRLQADTRVLGCNRRVQGL